MTQVEITTDLFLSIANDEEHLSIPKKLFFEDFLFKHLKPHIDVSGWHLCAEVFELLRINGKAIKSLSVNDCKGFVSSDIECLRGAFHALTIFSMRNTIALGVNLGKVFISWTKLSELDISGCKVENNLCRIICQSCSRLTKLVCQKCSGLDDFQLQAIGEGMGRHRSLTYLDLSHNRDFGDEGVLYVTNSGLFVIKHLILTNCTNVSSLSLAGLRKRMPSLEYLDISSMLLGQSPFEWIAEGCLFLKSLDLRKSANLDDVALSAIGARCNLLEEFNISFCTQISDIGIVEFFHNFSGRLKYFDMSGCILCGGQSLVAIATSSIELETLKLNGLSKVPAAGFQALWLKLPNLKYFEMAANLKSTNLHRQSVIPHISDGVLLKSVCTKLKSLKITGAVLVTDIGASFLSKKCPGLTRLDVNFCSGITDKFLRVLGLHSLELTRLNISGCGSITDIGIGFLCNGCKYLTHLEINGCSKVTDACFKSIALLENIENLYIRNCDNITDEGILMISRLLRKLKILEMSGLDLVSQKSIYAFSRYNHDLVSLTCESCRMNPVEVNIAAKNKFPYVQPVVAHCRLNLREAPILVFNQFCVYISKCHVMCLRLQRFCKRILINIRAKRTEKVTTWSAIKVQKLFRGHQGRRVTKKIISLRISVDLSATRLQRAMKRLMGIKYSKDKLRQLRHEDYSRRLLQKFYRGHMARKRVRDKFVKLYDIYRNLGILFYKYWYVQYSRILHKRIVLVQGRCRAFVIYRKYTAFRKGLILFQRFFRKYSKKKQTIFNLYTIQKLKIKRIYDAATIIKRFIKAVVFNSNILPFTIFCARYYDDYFGLKEWSALRIQSVFRKHLAILRVTAIKRRNIYLYRCQMRLVPVFRGCLVRRRFRRERSMIRNFKRLCLQRSRLILGKFVKKVQKLARLYIFRLRRLLSGSLVVRIARGFLGRLRWKSKLNTLRTVAKERIVRYFRKYKGRMWRRGIWARYHMACWKIQLHVRNRLINNVESKRRINVATTARKNREATKEKQEMLKKRREKIVANIAFRQHNVYASRIQRRFRRFKIEIEKYRDAMRKKKQNIEVATVAIKEIKANRRGLLPRISRSINETFRKLRKVFSVPDDSLPPKEIPRFTNAVLKFQTRSIVQEGIVDIRLTLGESEKINFQREQTQLMHEEAPYFEMVEGDLSGQMELQIHIWVCNGHGTGCICRLDIQSKPKMSKVSLRSREKELRSKGVRVAWHPNVHIEITGECSVMLGKGGFAVRDVRIAQDAHEEHKFEKKGFKLIESLHQFNLPTSVWAHSREPYPEDGMYKYGSLTAMDWFDKRLIKCISAFNLTESDVLGLRAVFEAIQGPNISFFVKTKYIFEYFRFPLVKMCEWVIAGIGPGSNEELSFSEYVHTVCFFCIFGRQELLRFIFGAADVEAKGYLRKDQFMILVEDLVEINPSNVREWQMQFGNYADPKLGYLFFTGFEKFCDEYNYILWQALYLHRTFMEKNLGEDFWTQKRTMFNQIREHLGVIVVV